MAEPPPGGSQEPEKPRTWWETPLSDVSALTAASRRCECGQETAIITKNDRGRECAARVEPASCRNGCGYSVGIATGMKMSKSNPCTNLPVQCPLPGCNAAVWRYSWVAHLTARHATEAANPSWRNHESFVVTSEEHAAMAALHV